MQALSVVILARNEARTIEAAVKSAVQVSHDVIVVDSGSTDNTIDLAKAAGARVLQVTWPGFGQARNLGADAAVSDTILCIDADEVITPGLVTSIANTGFLGGVIYGFKRRNFLAGRLIRFGEWGHDQVYRIYNRQYACWNNDKVHEMIIFRVQENKFAATASAGPAPSDLAGSVPATGRGKKVIEGSLLHYTTTDLVAYKEKLRRYAMLSAEKFFIQGKKAGVTKLYISPVFSFIKNYIFRLGFLDGKAGLDIALLHAGYTQNKYRYLKKLYKQA